MPERLSASEVRDLLHAKLDSLLQECETVAENAEHGRTVHDLDDFLFIAGRKFMKEVYQHKLQEQIEHNETNTESNGWRSKSALLRGVSVV